MENNHEIVRSNNTLTPTATDSFLFAIPTELLAKIIACCDSQTRNKLMRTNEYLRFYASKGNYAVILMQSPLWLNFYDQINYVEFLHL